MAAFAPAEVEVAGLGVTPKGWLSWPPGPMPAEGGSRVLMVVTSTEKFGWGPATGCWLESVAAAWYVFRDFGYYIDIASIKGGAAPLEPASLGPLWLTAPGKRFMEDAEAQGAMKQTLKLGDIAKNVAEKYDLIYFADGHGAVYDFTNNACTVAVKKMAGALKPIVCVGHGVAAVVNETAMLKREPVTCFTNMEETLLGHDAGGALVMREHHTEVRHINPGKPPATHVIVHDAQPNAREGLDQRLPLNIEDKLKEAQVKFRKVGHWCPHVVESKNGLVTGQNFHSAAAAAEVGVAKVHIRGVDGFALSQHLFGPEKVVNLTEDESKARAARTAPAIDEDGELDEDYEDYHKFQRSPLFAGFEPGMDDAAYNVRE